MVHTANHTLIPTVDCIEYYSLVPTKRKVLLRALKRSCSSYSSAISSTTVDTLDLYLLSRIFLDIIIAHVEGTNQIPSVINQPENTEHNIKTDLVTQQDEFEKNLAYYGKRTLDRFNVLKQYSSNNAFAAHELGLLYFYGEDLLFGGNNHFTILPDYRLAIKYFLCAINNVSPPYAPACWWIGYILKENYIAEEAGKEFNLKKAKYYFELADAYPPAYNSLAQLEILETDNIYTLYKQGRTTFTFQEIVQKYVHALELAGKAADAKLFYASNTIADFINKHQQDSYLFSEIEKRIHLSTPFSFIAQIKLACSNNNPWALHELACYYLRNEQPDKAHPLLTKACYLNYNRAYYTLAINFFTGSLKETTLKRAFKLSYPRAGYEIALIYCKSNQKDIAMEYLLNAEQMNNSLHKIDTDLQQDILNLKRVLN